MEAREAAHGTERDATAPASRTAPFRIADWRVDPDLNRVSRHDDALQIEPKVMSVLLRLAEEPGEVVTKRQLLDAVWNGDFVTESVLSRAIAELRSHLGDDARNPSYIETIPKRGYRLIAETSTLGDEGTIAEQPDPLTAPPLAAPPGVRRWVMGAAAALSAVAVAIVVLGGAGLAKRVSSRAAGDPPRLIVFPFDNYGPDERANFALGITEEITSQLAMVPGLQVISRTTAVNYDRRGKTVRQVAHELDIDYILEGSVRWESHSDGTERVRITPQLIRVSEDAHVWSASYDRRPDELLAIQSEIGRLVVDRLDLAVAASAGTFAPVDLDAAAYQAFLDGRSHLGSDEEQDFRAAIASLERAVELEPSFVRAWAQLAEANGRMVHFGFDPSAERIERARSALQHAIELDPDLPEVHRATGFYLYHCRRDLASALAELEIAAKGLPNDSEVLAGIAFIERRRGNWERSLATHRRAIELDPWNPYTLWNMASSLFYMRRYPEAEDVFDRVIAIAPGIRTPHFLRVTSMLCRDGTTERARLALEAIPGPRDDRWQVAAWRLDVVDGDYDAAIARVEAAGVGRWDGVPLSFFACVSRRATGRDPPADSCREAVAALQRDLDSEPHNLRVLTTLAEAAALAGDLASAAQCGETAARLGQSIDDATFAAELEVELARIDMLTGDLDGAFDRLEAVLRRPAPISAAVLQHSAEWAALRDHPRFQQLLES